VEVEETGAPTKESSIPSQSRLKCHVFEEAISLISIESGRVAGKVGLEDRQSAIAIDVGRRDAHSRLGFSIRSKRDSRFDSGVGEGSIMIVLEEGRRAGIVGHVDVGPTIVVEIAHKNTQTVGAFFAKNAGLLGHVGERSVAIIVEENVFTTYETRRATGDNQ